MFAFLVAARFAALIGFTAAVSIRQRQPRSHDVTSTSYRSQSISVRYNRTATRRKHALRIRTIYAARI